MVNTVHLYIFEGFADWEAAFAIAGLNQPQFQRHPGQWRVQTVGAARQSTVQSMGGLTVLPDLGLDDLQPQDSSLFILPGGLGWEAEETPHERAVRHALACLEYHVPVAAICGATAGLAKAGALDRRPHTSNARTYLKGTGYHGSDFYREEAVVTDQGLVTAGGMAPLEFARAIFDILGVYEPAVLEAWYQLYKTGKSEYFAQMASAAAPTS